MRTIASRTVALQDRFFHRFFSRTWLALSFDLSMLQTSRYLTVSSRVQRVGSISTSVTPQSWRSPFRTTVLFPLACSPIVACSGRSCWRRSTRRHGASSKTSRSDPGVGRTPGDVQGRSISYQKASLIRRGLIRGLVAANTAKTRQARARSGSAASPRGGLTEIRLPLHGSKMACRRKVYKGVPPRGRGGVWFSSRA